jgi:hypothetical protein
VQGTIARGTVAEAATHCFFSPPEFWKRNPTDPTDLRSDSVWLLLEAHALLWIDLALKRPCVRDYQRGVLGDRIAILRLRHAASNRFVMFGADIQHPVIRVRDRATVRSSVGKFG